MTPSDYADLLFMRHINSSLFDERVGDGWLPLEEFKQTLQDVMRQVFLAYGYDAGHSFDDLAIENVGWLVEKGAITKEGDDYTGTYVKLNNSKKNDVTEIFIKNTEVGRRISALGEPALEKAVHKIANEIGWGGSHENSPNSVQSASLSTAPASDRVVTFSDNQVVELDEQASEVISAVSGQNQIDGEPGLREIILGQLKAGRELIRAGSFRLYLIELTLLDTLRFIAKRYEREAIGGLASALIVALVKYIGIDA